MEYSRKKESQNNISSSLKYRKFNKAKLDILSKMFKNTDLLALQETHVTVHKTDKTTLRLLENMISNRKLRVSLNGKVNGYKILQNGLHQGSVLSTIIFITYTDDTISMTSRKFIYAKHVALVAQVSDQRIYIYTYMLCDYTLHIYAHKVNGVFRISGDSNGDCIVFGSL